MRSEFNISDRRGRGLHKYANASLIRLQAAAEDGQTNLAVILNLLMLTFSVCLVRYLIYDSNTCMYM